MSKYSEFRIPKSAFQNWGSFRLFHSAIRIPQSAIGNRGFTLIEIIILIVMAGILLPAIVVPFVTGVKASGKAEMVNTAMFLAQQRMEEFMKFDYSKSPELDPTVGFVSFSTGDPNYPGEYEIVYVDSNLSTPSTDAGYKRIIVRVRDPENTNYEIYSVVTNFP